MKNKKLLVLMERGSVLTFNDGSVTLTREYYQTLMRTIGRFERERKLALLAATPFAKGEPIQRLP